MRKISASYIFPGIQPPLKNGILICRDDGTIIELIDTKGNLREQAGLEYYSGIVVPGFINAHCHLELSHLKGKITEKTGLGEFLGQLNRIRNAGNDALEEAIQKADFQMKHSGIAAVGDISNSIITLETKKNSSIYYHTFAEAFGFQPARAEMAFLSAEFISKQFSDSGLPVSVTPHASYSVSEELFKKIKMKARADNSLLSFHNQESPDEEELFNNFSGPLLHHLKNVLGLTVPQREPRKQHMLEYVLTFFPKENQLLLVHNTLTKATDIAFIRKHRDMNNTYFVLCPNSNLYIENRLPEVPSFMREELNLCIGTDSLASNHQLSVLQEMITLQTHFPEITLQNLIEWACINGAHALCAADRLGSFEAGKRPGINLITGTDLHQLRLTSSSKVKVLQPAI